MLVVFVVRKPVAILVQIAVAIAIATIVSRICLLRAILRARDGALLDLCDFILLRQNRYASPGIGLIHAGGYKPSVLVFMRRIFMHLIGVECALGLCDGMDKICGQIICFGQRSEVVPDFLFRGRMRCLRCPRFGLCVGMLTGLVVALREEKMVGIVVWMTLVKMIFLGLRAIVE